MITQHFIELARRDTYTYDPINRVILVRDWNSGRFPAFIRVTGLRETHDFSQDHDKAMCNEFWDGIQMEYISKTTDIRIIICLF